MCRYHDHNKATQMANKRLISVCHKFKDSPQHAALQELLRQQLELLKIDMNMDSVDNLYKLNQIKEYRTANFHENSPVVRDADWKTYVTYMIDIKVHMMAAVLQQECLAAPGI